jgi:hypothetical protein
MLMMFCVDVVVDDIRGKGSMDAAFFDDDGSYSYRREREREREIERGYVDKRTIWNAG